MTLELFANLKIGAHGEGELAAWASEPARAQEEMAPECLQFVEHPEGYPLRRGRARGGSRVICYSRPRLCVRTPASRKIWLARSRRIGT